MPRRKKHQATSPANDPLTLALAPLIAAEVKAQLAHIARSWLAQNAPTERAEAPSGGAIGTDVVPPKPEHVAHSKPTNGAKKHAESAP